MKKSFFSFFFGLFTLLILAGSCCSPCEKPSLGQFTLKEEVKTWLDFAPTTRTYKSTTGKTVVMAFSEVNTGFVVQLANCDEIDRCGLCCNEFENQFVSVQGTSDDLNFLVEISITKDFLIHNPSEGNENISEVLEVRMNNLDNLMCRLGNLAEVELIENITLNGTTYSQVWVCEDPALLTFANDSQVTGVFMNKQEGLLGWRLGVNEIWGLL